MKILVTGASGFLGGHVVEYLLERGIAPEEIVAAGRREVPWIAKLGVEYLSVDLSDAEAMVQTSDEFTHIIHCAALSAPWGAYEDFHRVNVVGMANVLALAGRCRRLERFVDISTPSIYFGLEEQLDVAEDSTIPDNFLNSYARSKWAAEQLLRKTKLPFIILRPRALFGERDTSIIPRLIRANSRGMLPLVDDGQALLDSTYVGNVAHAIHLALFSDTSTVGQTYNITNLETLSLKETLTRLFGKLGVPMRPRKLSHGTALGIARSLEWLSIHTGEVWEPPLTIYSATVLSRSQTLNVSKAQRELGYVPIYSLDEGLDRYVEWLRSEEDNG
jgi:nucleoside-diphosphate-sugar epimerase